MKCLNLRRFGFTLVELLVVIAIISIIAGLVVEGIALARDKADRLVCSNNLRGIHMAATSYAEKHGAYPIASGSEPAAHESLNVLLESRFGARLKPRDFVSRAGEASKAEMDEDAPQGATKFQLGPHESAYAYAGRRLRPSSEGYLASCKYYDGYEDENGVHSGHHGVVMAIDTSGRVVELEISELTEEGVPPGLVR